MLRGQVRRVHDVVKREKTGKLFVKEGPGGRSSNAGITATVFGATGFVGRYLVNNLGKKGTTVVTPFRGIEDDKRHLRLMGDLGQIIQPRYDLRNEVQIAESLRHSDVVYNLVGRSYSTKNFSLERVHVEGARTMARLARENGVSKFIHMSALGANVNSPSEFLRTKALGEQAVLEEFPDATIVRPARIFGNEDWFIKQMGFFAKWMPGSYIPIINGGLAKMRPVYVSDVAACLAMMLKDDVSVGKVVELYGPREYYYKSLVDLFQDVTMNQKHVANLPKFVAKPFFKLWSSVLAFPIMTADEVERLVISDVFSKNALTLKDFDIHPHTLEETIIRFVYMYRPHEFAMAPNEPILKKYTTKEV
ncbi:hypothetical protein EDD86DRAFT_222931 [Gorgonomyces haynaldii]|nr:hypothetical protein EDD86DRAFT_222931 [Gorgonomyces haynaldii]